MGTRAQAALAFETTYGTAPASGYTLVPFASSSLGAVQPLLDNEVLGNGRDPHAPMRDAIDVDGDFVVPVDAEAIGFWLAALLGAPTTTGAGPYTHSYVSGATSLPSLAIEIAHPEVPQFAMYSGIKANSFALSMQRKGLVTATVGLVAQAEATATTTGAGTPAALTLTRFGGFNGSVTRNATNIGSIVSASLTYSNNLDRVETIRNDGLIEGLDPGMCSLGGQLVARFDSTTLLDQAIAGTPCSLDFDYQISAGVKLTLTAHEVYLPRPKKEVTGPGGVQVTFDWQAAKASSPARMMTAVLINAVATY